MSVTLTKIIHGKPAVFDILENEQIVKCPRCEQTYRLGYSDNEWNKVKDWLKHAERAIRDDHDLKHEVLTIRLEWRIGDVEPVQPALPLSRGSSHSSQQRMDSL